MKILFKFTYIFILASLFILIRERQIAFSKEPKPSEYAVKAAFLFNFAKFIEWPGEENIDSLFLTVLGEDPFERVLDELQGKMIRGKKLKVQRLKSIQELKQSHILFISSSLKLQAPQILRSLEGAPTLTIGEVDGFCQQGGIINLYLDQNKVRFEINLIAAKKAGLKIHSNLLKLAKIVNGDHKIGQR